MQGSLKESYLIWMTVCAIGTNCHIPERAGQFPEGCGGPKRGLGCDCGGHRGDYHRRGGAGARVA